MGAADEPQSGGVIENACLTPTTFGLFAHRSSLDRALSFIKNNLMTRENAAATTVAPELPCPGKEFILIEPQVFPELDVWHLVGPGALVKPGHLDAEEAGRLLNGQERHRVFLVVVAPRVAVGSTSAE